MRIYKNDNEKEKLLFIIILAVEVVLYVPDLKKNYVKWELKSKNILDANIRDNLVVIHLKTKDISLNVKINYFFLLY